MSEAVLVVDVQVDFCEGGSLAVAGGAAVARNVSEFLATETFDLVVASQDWHDAPPATNDGHFSTAPDFVDSWPVHCVAGSRGAMLHPDLVLPADVVLVRKGQGRSDYSAFQGVAEGTRLGEVLARADVERLHVMGIATDHCVRASVLDALGLGLAVTVHADLCAGVSEEGTMKALAEMSSAGAEIVRSR